MVATLDHDLHRKRRGLLSHYFSKLSVRRLEPVIQATAAKLCARLAADKANGESVNIMSAYCALTADLISEYSFGHSYGLLSAPAYGPELYTAIVGNSEKMHVTKQFDWFIPLLQRLPAWLRKRVFPSIHVLFAFRQKLEEQVVGIKREWEAEQSRAKAGDKKIDLNHGSDDDETKENIFSALLDPTIPASELSTPRLVGEAQAFVMAGTVTLAHTMTVATYHVLTNPHVLASLLSELSATMPDPPASPLSLATLESLPYLNAVINESLRIGYGVSHRLQRIAPDRAIAYGSYTIPPGTPVSMDSVHMHTNASIFPNPYRFDPERWLPLETEGLRLQKYLVAMSRGSRMCIGVNLAFAELLIGLGRVFRELGSEMEVFGTERRRDVDVSHDLFNPMPEKGSRGVWVRFRGSKGM